MAIQRAFLLIADIGGYTRFMRLHRINLAHAQEIVAELLEAVIDAATPKLTLAKLEGDAAFFYAKVSADSDVAKLLPSVAKIRRGFVAKRTRMTVDQMCSCDSCEQAGRLKLKFAVHAGEIALQRVKSYTELAGMDVILVHRMLKNSVPVAEYVLMTAPVHAQAGEEIQSHAKSIEEDFEGVGPTALHYADLEEIAKAAPPELAPSRLRALWEYIVFNVRSVPYMLGWKKACLGFRNFEGAPALPAETTPSIVPPDA